MRKLSKRSHGQIKHTIESYGSLSCVCICRNCWSDFNWLIGNNESYQSHIGGGLIGG